MNCTNFFRFSLLTVCVCTGCVEDKKSQTNPIAAAHKNNCEHSEKAASNAVKWSQKHLPDLEKTIDDLLKIQNTEMKEIAREAAQNVARSSAYAAAYMAPYESAFRAARDTYILSYSCSYAVALGITDIIYFKVKVMETLYDILRKSEEE